MGIYTAVHNFCTSQKAMGNGSVPPNMPLNSANRGGMASFSPTMISFHQSFLLTHSDGAAHLLGEELYNKLIDFLKVHLEGLVQQSKSHTDEALLGFYIREWNRYTNAAKYIHH